MTPRQINEVNDDVAEASLTCIVRNGFTQNLERTVISKDLYFPKIATPQPPEFILNFNPIWNHNTFGNNKIQAPFTFHQEG